MPVCRLSRTSPTVNVPAPPHDDSRGVDLRLILENISDVLWVWDVAADRFVYFSPSVERLLGYSVEEALTLAAADTMTPASYEFISGILPGRLAHFAETGSAVDRYEIEQRRKDGTLSWSELTTRFVADAAGRVLVYGATRDISERRRAEQALHEREEFFRVLVETTFDWAWEVDTEGRYTFASEKVFDILGYTPAEVVGRTPFDFMPPEEAARVSSFFITSVESRAPFSAIRNLNLHKDGREVLLETSGMPFFGPEGDFRGYRGMDRDVTAHAHAERTVERLVSGSPSVIYALRPKADYWELEWYGGNLQGITGWTPQDATGPGWWLTNIHPEDQARVVAANRPPAQATQSVLEFRFRRKDGAYVWVRDHKRFILDPDGTPVEAIGSWSDITDRVLLEEQLRQAQKMEAIGRLAGGVAHDFNNLLTIISGAVELLRMQLPAGPAHHLLSEVADAGERAASLTRQLLAFSRAQVLAPKVIDLNESVRRTEGMLRRLIGEDVALTCAYDGQAGHVLVDPGQLEQVILNIAVNARDAMPTGGQMTIETGVVEFDEQYCRRNPEASPGRFARLAIADSGSGMTADVKARIFEPFFTTKVAGKGTGLGLATVFGIVKQSGGHLDVVSEPGAGACFTVFLPQVAPGDRAEVQAGAPAPARGHEIVLLVEDEDALRRVARIALEGFGYRVLVARHGKAALELVAGQPEPVDLLVTDMVMPGMSGRQLAETLRERFAGLKVLFMSGYVDDSLIRNGLVEGETPFLHKPFNLADLRAKVREVLDAPA